MKRLRNNGLSIVFFLMFLVTICGQIVTGQKQYNLERTELGATAASLGAYLRSGHFIESTFENWESEFLQMGLFVVLTIFLYQRGSSESKDPDDPSCDVDREPSKKRKGAPWPVRRGGFILSIYKNSLTYALAFLFLASFLLHTYGSLRVFNEEEGMKGNATETFLQYLGNSRLWFESFQNWQSEFLSVMAIIVLSIYLRQKGSPQSKPVDAPHFETGE